MFATSRVRKGPPDAVRMIFSMQCAQESGSDGKDWNIAECSLSMGSNVAPPFLTARRKTSPPTTSASLFARSSRLPASAAARHGARPAAPTIAAMTISTDSCDAIISRASLDHKTVESSPFILIFSARMRPCGSLAMTTYRGLNCATCASMSSTWVDALSANTSYRSGCLATTSRVLVPMEPVDPRTVTRCFMTCPAKPASWPGARLAAMHQHGPERRRDRAEVRCCP